MHTDIARLFAKVWFGVTCATGSLAFPCGAAAAAGVVGIESSVTGLDRGQELADDQSLNIPAGSHLLVGVVQGAQLQQVDIVGPRAGSVKDLLNPEPTSSAL